MKKFNVACFQLCSSESVEKNIVMIDKMFNSIEKKLDLVCLPECAAIFTDSKRKLDNYSDRWHEKFMNFIKEKNNQENPIDIFMMKDFMAESLPITNELISLGYYSFNIEPNMILKINPMWENFDDYLAVLKTKFRVKAKKAMKLSNDLVTKEISVLNFDNHLIKMTELYKKVASKADFNLGEFKLETYKSFKTKLGDSYILKSYWIENKMVGFMSGMINKSHLDAHFVVIDYEINKQYAIYQRMLYDYIKIAIDNKIEILNFGRTASEIKSSVGAVPQHLTVYIRHKKSIRNKFLKLFLLKIQPTEFKQKFPFKIDKKIHEDNR